MISDRSFVINDSWFEVEENRVWPFTLHCTWSEEYVNLDDVTGEQPGVDLVPDDVIESLREEAERFLSDWEGPEPAIEDPTFIAAAADLGISFPPDETT